MSDRIDLRRGNAADSYAAMTVTECAMTDYCRRCGLVAPSVSLPDSAELDATWKRERPLYEFLAANADEWWVAEQFGRITAHARSIISDGVRELTEFFVHPQVQGAGIGRKLLSKAFPQAGARRRTILSTLDPGAQILYMSSGVYPRFPLRGFQRAPETIENDTDLAFRPIGETEPAIDAMGAIDEEILGYRRTPTHRWLLSKRYGFLCYRGEHKVGYGYVGEDSGPFAALDPADLAAILSHAETQASRQKLESFSLLVPLVCATVVDYVTRRRYRMSRMVFELMMDAPFGNFDRYVAGSVFFL